MQGLSLLKGAHPCLWIRMHVSWPRNNQQAPPFTHIRGGWNWKNLCHWTFQQAKQSVTNCFGHVKVSVSLFLTVRCTQGRQGTSREAGRNLGERRNRRLVHSLLTGTAAVRADALYPLVSWRSSGRSRIVATRAFLLELTNVYRAKAVCGHTPCEVRALRCERAQLMQSRVFTKRGAGAGGSGRESLITTSLARLLFPSCRIQGPGIF